MYYRLSSKNTALPDYCLVRGLLAEQAPERLQESGDFIWQEKDGALQLLIHCGTKASYTQAALRAFIKTAAKALQQQKIKKILVDFPALDAITPDAQIQFMLLELDYHFYKLLAFKTRDAQPFALEEVLLYSPKAGEQSLKQAEIIAQGIRFTRTLVNLPGNKATPTYLGKEAEALSKNKKLRCTVLDKKKLEALGMGALLAVGQGSVEPPCLIEIHYQGAPSSQAPVVLVGKGITFDSGGISLKDPENMHEMKFDMAGAATVLGAVSTAAALDLPLNIIGLVASAENMPSGSAIKPGDIVTTLSGQTVEITNTDAEGRLVLADALTYAERFNPDFVIDMATLTGAMVIALGYEHTGFMTQDEPLAQALTKAAKDSLDKAWRMPLDKAYIKPLESPIADIANAGPSRAAGSLSAAFFLSRFTEKYRWAHLDIAGTAWDSAKDGQATGRPLPLIMQLLRNLCHAR